MSDDQDFATPEDEEKFIRDWSIACTEFLSLPASNGWPGGEGPMHALRIVVEELKLMDAPDKVAALTLAVTELKRRGLVGSEQLK